MLTVGGSVTFAVEDDRLFKPLCTPVLRLNGAAGTSETKPLLYQSNYFFPAATAVSPAYHSLSLLACPVVVEKRVRYSDSPGFENSGNLESRTGFLRSCGSGGCFKRSESRVRW